MGVGRTIWLVISYLASLYMDNISSLPSVPPPVPPGIRRGQIASSTTTAAGEGFPASDFSTRLSPADDPRSGQSEPPLPSTTVLEPLLKAQTAAAAQDQGVLKRGHSHSTTATGQNDHSLSTTTKEPPRQSTRDFLTTRTGHVGANDARDVRDASNLEPPDPHQRRSAKTEHILNSLHHYEMVVPALVDDQGQFLSYDVTDKPHQKQQQQQQQRHSSRRTRRSTSFSSDDFRDDKQMPEKGRVTPEKSVYYSLSAYGIDFHFNLTLNTALVSPRYVLEYWTGSGNVWRRKGTARPCHYVGHLNSNRETRVALSNCFGLHGVFATKDEEYFVEPLWNDTHNIDREGHFHIVYKRSALKTMFKESQCGVKDTTKKSSHIPQHWMGDGTIRTSYPSTSFSSSSPKTSSSSFHNDVIKKPTSGGHKKFTSGFGRTGSGSTRYVNKWERRKRRKRRSVSQERHVETLVVVDKMMIGYHGTEEVEPYVLTVMNIVANLYHDASIGNAINIMVTRLVLLSKDQPNLSIDHHADRSLESFCRWQQTINPPHASTSSRDQGVAHHDNAVLITRYDICTYKNEPCGTLGLAPVAGMCEADRSCSINEDIGLASAFTIAHEIGHNFGMQHDGAGNTCGKPGREPAKIMAAQLTKNSEPFSWSSCSREYITGFLDSGRGKCLENPPPEQEFEFPTRQPGQIHDANAQCEFQHGSRSRACRLGEVCRELWCTNHKQKCVTNNIPAAEGTSCSTTNVSNGWCYRGKCVRYGWKPSPVSGGWGAWSEWRSCSRTCDGGVESSERYCNNPRPRNGGKYCIGERKRYRSCNTMDCPINSTDFREVQCSSFNDVPFRGKYYKWKPFSGVKPCALNCLAVGYNFYTERAPEVIDGTRCYPDSINMCINGECKHVGCDRILGSDAVEDKCRVCGGDGTSCDTIAGTFEESLNSSEEGQENEEAYHEVVRIPQGTVHIKISEITFCRNYLALMSADGEYYINGAWTIDWPRKFEVANTVFHYQRPTDQPESLTALGPTSEDLVIMVLVQGENTGIRYQYNMAIGNHSSHGNGTEFLWKHTPWSECSRTCAKGISRSEAVCVKKDHQSKIVKTKYCVSHLKPNERIKYCNEEPCPAEWSIGDWEECSKTCGGGLRTREVQCRRLVRGNISEVLPSKNCRGKKPRSRQTCNRGKCPPHWASDGWTDCRPRCGPGKQSRNVYCVSAEGHYMQASHCNGTRPPPKARKCNAGACPPPAWEPGEWEECSAKCGTGQQRRRIICNMYNGERSNDCDSTAKPAEFRQCDGTCELDKGDDLECKDVNKVAYCPLVLKFRFCSRAYFRQMCCKTCSEAGF